jgi:hypothetical protein
MNCLFILRWISVFATLIAAILWLSSARVAIPPILLPTISRDRGIERPPHERAFRMQARLSGFAALSAAVAAIAQAIVTLMGG